MARQIRPGEALVMPGPVLQPLIMDVLRPYVDVYGGKRATARYPHEGYFLPVLEGLYAPLIFFVVPLTFLFLLGIVFNVFGIPSFTIPLFKEAWGLLIVLTALRPILLLASYPLRRWRKTWIENPPSAEK